MKVHELKIDPKYFDEIVDGIKTFEVRKNDRNFKVGDHLLLKVFDKERGFYSGNNVTVKITYILDDQEFLRENYVILGIKRI